MAAKSDACMDIENAKLEYMKIRFRLVIGDAIKSHEVQAAKRKIADAVRTANSVNKN